MALFCCDKYKGYKNVWLASEPGNVCFQEFLEFSKGNQLSECTKPYAIQAVEKEDFGPTLRTKWFIRRDKSFVIDDTNNGDQTFLRSNDFKNFKCGAHKRFFELNLYTASGVSHHHTSHRSGNSYDRDASIDQATGTTKGPHW